MLAIVLGGAPKVWSDAEAVQRLLNGRRHLVVAANLALIHYRGHLDAVATLHPDLLEGWIAQRPGNKDFRRFTPDTTPERWPGSSGLYALQVALFEMGATGAILCGVPMVSAAGHFIQPGSWAGVDDYRQAFIAALPEIGGRVRSMGGWTEQAFGKPTPEWVGAIDNHKPLRASAPERTDMHKVTNVSKERQTFWAPGEDGLSKLFKLNPGDSVNADVDPNQPKFSGDVLRIGNAPSAKKAAARKPASKKTKAPAPKKPVAPVEPPADPQG